MIKGIKIRLYPNKTQQEQLTNNFGSVRLLWNQMLAMQNERYSNGGSYVGRFAMNNIIPALKKEYPWLEKVESTSLQNVNNDLDKAFKNLFEKRARKPRFKRKSDLSQSFTITCVNNNIQVIDEHHIKIPKLKYVYYRSSGIPKGKIKSITIKHQASGKYYASISMEVEDRVTLTKTGKSCGIDLGLKDLVILDDGTKLPLPRFDKQLEDKLHYWQRLASRRLLRAKEVIKAKDNELQLTDFKNYQKARQMVAKIHEHIANQRYDYLHKLSTWLVSSYDVIVLEDLHVKIMVKNHKLARAISNAGWHKLVEMLKYKCKQNNKTLITVDPSYTSQTCNNCGYVNNRMGYNRYGWLKVRKWQCPECNTLHDRDINASKNILDRGLIALSV